MAIDSTVKSYVGTNSSDGIVVGLDSTVPVGFYGHAPVARQTVSAAATDSATVIVLANSLRTALVALGIVA